jgi:oxygen-dependent protoporphyrinogen oxidase
MDRRARRAVRGGEPERRVKIGVIGAGIAGLAAASRLAVEHDVTVFERDGVPGGKMRSEALDGYLFEWGPNGFLSTHAGALSLVREAGIEGDLVEANPAAAKRYIFWNGRLHALPAKPQQALAMSLLSAPGKLRALRELFTRPPAAVPERESVHAFFTRHFGAQVADRIVAPALLGITGGDARLSSVDALFPRLRVMERERGSVLRALTRGTAGARAKLLGFGARGMQHFPRTLAERLGERVRYGAFVERVRPGSAAWVVEGDGFSQSFDAVVVAAPAGAAAQMLAGADPQLAALLARIPYAAMRLAGVAFRETDVPRPLDGFGFLAAREAGLRILGALFTSTMFAGQAPPGVAYLRVFLGGAADPDAALLETGEVRAIVLRDLERSLGIRAEPVAFHEARWSEAIPQYGLDHVDTVAQIERRAKSHAGLLLAGNAYHGIGAGDAVASGLAAAERLNA